MRVKSDIEKLEETFHAQQSSNREFFLESNFGIYRSTGQINRYLMKISCFTSTDALSDLNVATLEIQSQMSGKVRMKQSTGCSRINDRLKSLGARSMRLRKRDVDVKQGGIKACARRSTRIRIDFIRYLQARSQTDKGNQLAGVLMISGSDSPARSLSSTTSEYVAPVATIFDSSSDRAIQLLSGAVRNSSKRFTFSGDIICPLNDIDAKAYPSVSSGSTKLW